MADQTIRQTSRRTYNVNRTNLKRKPEARRKRWQKKAMQRGALNPSLPRFATQSAIKQSTAQQSRRCCRGDEAFEEQVYADALG